MGKASYATLARYVPRNSIDEEVAEVLDALLELAARATPATGER